MTLIYYASSREGRRGLTITRDRVDASIQRLEHWIKSANKD